MLEVSPVRAFSDNYIWLIRTLGDPAGAAVVEPGDARPVEDVLDREGLRLRAIFVTHHRITSEESASPPPDPERRYLVRRSRPGSRQAVNCVHATSRRCRLRSASNDASTRSCDAGNPRSEPGRGARGSARELDRGGIAVIRSWKDGFR
jgi:hypothetical protein